jgi:DNA-binding NtrC family response regulator
LTVLIQGETGTGKEVVARCLHAWSNRADKPFITVDCGALSESLIESELFGYRKGAFTGAERRKAGYFELAEGGTLFLDEISNLSLHAQAKLLRCVQERRIFPLGSEREMHIDARLLVASNLPLAEEVTAGRFRSDLFHRLNEFQLYLLPLRERREDILVLAEQFCQEGDREWQRNPHRFSPEAQTYLLTHEWPGNVRELRNAIRRAVLLSTDVIEKRHLCQPSAYITQERDVAPTGSGVHGLPGKSPPAMVDQVWTELESMLIRQVLQATNGNQSKTAMGSGVHGLPGKSLPAMVDQVRTELESILIQRVLQATNGNQSKAAKHLKIGYKTLQRKLKIYKIVR